MENNKNNNLKSITSKKEISPDTSHINEPKVLPKAIILRDLENNNARPSNVNPPKVMINAIQTIEKADSSKKRSK